MSELMHLIYSSAATQHFGRDELVELLDRARTTNSKLDISGMLLYIDGSFLQVLEGAPDQVDALFSHIAKDSRHTTVVTIIREPIAKRTFSDWSMGFADVSTDDLNAIDGLNDFFTGEACFTGLGAGRTKKLLNAFKSGRWRSRIEGINPPATPSVAREREPSAPPTPDPAPPELALDIENLAVSFAFQPIVDVANQQISSYEAIVKTDSGGSAEEFLSPHMAGPNSGLLQRELQHRAIALAAKLGLNTGLTLKYSASGIEEADQLMSETLEIGERYGFTGNQITLEIDQDQLTGDTSWFAAVIQKQRGLGLRFSIDHFGDGRSGLSLIDAYQPDSVALNRNLVTGIESHGARQAIVRGVIQTCDDLGIDLIAKHVETEAEIAWFRYEGVELFQGTIIAPPTFEELSGDIGYTERLAA